jgi:uncharacterized protein
MATTKAKPATKAKRQAGIFGVHPLLAAVLAIVLVCVGAVGGAWLNISSREPVRVAAMPPKPPTPAKPRTAPPAGAAPVIALADEVADDDEAEEVLPSEPPSLFDKNPPRVMAAVPPAPVLMPRESNPASAYAAAFNGPFDKPAVAIVIDDMGLDRVRSQRALEMQGPLTLSFLTYAVNLSTWALRAREAGHEVMAHLPMEPLDAKENPGPGALKVALTDDEVLTRFNGALDPWMGYVGVNNHMGSKFTADAAKMDVVMRALKARGLLWLDSKTSGNSVGTSLARALNVPHVERDVFLDNIQNEDDVLKELASLEQVARQRGSAIAIGHPHDVTLSVLTEWITSLPGKGLVLAPLTEVARRQVAERQQRAGAQ